MDSSGDLPLPLDLALERHVPLLETLEIRAVDAERGRAVFEMTVDEKHLRTLGLMHGGVTATLLDTAMGYAAVTVAPKDRQVVTVQLNLNYVRPAWKSERLVATGEIRHSGRQTAVAHGELHTADGTLVASGSATMMFIALPDAPQPVAEETEP